MGLDHRKPVSGLGQALKRRETADFDSPDPAPADTAASGSRTARLAGSDPGQLPDRWISLSPDSSAAEGEGLRNYVPAPRLLGGRAYICAVSTGRVSTERSDRSAPIPPEACRRAAELDLLPLSGFAATTATSATGLKTNGFQAPPSASDPPLPPHDGGGETAAATSFALFSLGILLSVADVADVALPGDPGR
jgi:hypothetical protein